MSEIDNSLPDKPLNGTVKEPLHAYTETYNSSTHEVTVEILRSRIFFANLYNYLGLMMPGKELEASPSEAIEWMKQYYRDYHIGLTILKQHVTSDKILADFKSTEATLKRFPALNTLKHFGDIDKYLYYSGDMVNNFGKYRDNAISKFAMLGIEIILDSKTINTIEHNHQKGIVKNGKEYSETHHSATGKAGSAKVYDKENAEINLKETASSILKIIVETVPTGKKIDGIMTEYAEADEIMDDLFYIGSALQLSDFCEGEIKFEKFIALLEARATKRPYLKDLAVRLQKYFNEGKADLINNILKNISVDFREQTIVLYKSLAGKTFATGIEDVMIINSNRDTPDKWILKEWEEAHTNCRTFFRLHKNTGQLFVIPEKIQHLQGIIQTFRAGGAANIKKKVQEFFAVTGIELKDSDMDVIAVELIPDSAGTAKHFSGIQFFLQYAVDSFRKNKNRAYNGKYGLDNIGTVMAKMAKAYYLANPGKYGVHPSTNAIGRYQYLFQSPTYITNKTRAWLLNQRSRFYASAFFAASKDFWDCVGNDAMKITFSLNNSFSGTRDTSDKTTRGKILKHFTDKDLQVGMYLLHQGKGSNLGHYIPFPSKSKFGAVEAKMNKAFFVDAKGTSNMGESHFFSKKETTVGTTKSTTLLYGKSMHLAIYENFVAPEVARIQASLKMGKQAISNIDVATKLFYICPEINTKEEFKEFRRKLYSGQELAEAEMVEAGKHMFKSLQNSVSTKVLEFINLGFVSKSGKMFEFPLFVQNYVKKARKATELENLALAEFMILDFTLNDMAAQIRTMQFLRLDPWTFFKANEDILYKQNGEGNKVAKMFSEFSSKDKELMVKSTWEEFNTYAAGALEFGSQGAHNWCYKDTTGTIQTYSSGVSYRVAIAHDVNPAGGVIAGEQEFVTVQEHIDLLMSEGNVPVEIWSSITEKIREAGLGGYYTFSATELPFIYKPTKVSYFNDAALGETGLNRIDYVKSMRFPLIPQLEAGSERDKMRIWMERNNIRSLIFVSAKKLGKPANPVTLFSEDGSSFTEPSSSATEAAVQVFSRDGLRTQ